MLDHDDMCRLSRAFNQQANLGAVQDARINEWLKEQIGEIAPKPWTNGNHPQDCGCIHCNI